jgi:hypothetical protein
MLLKYLTLIGMITNEGKIYMREIISGFITLLIFLIILCFSTFPYGGGVKEIEDANPKYQNPNRHFQNLVEMYNAHPENLSKNWDWSRAYFSECDMYGKDWDKIESCFFAYRTCESKKPLIEENGFQKYDIFSKENEPEYRDCLKLFKPRSWRVSLWFWIGKTFFNGHG